MKRFIKKSSMLLCLTLFAACSNDGFNEQEPPQPEPQPQPLPLPEQTYPLTVEVTENPMITDGEESNSSNRAPITTGSTLTSFKMNYVYDTDETGSVTATKTEEGKWESSAPWPTDAAAIDDEVNWYAYTHGTFYINSGTPYISFEVEEYVADQHDLLVATANGKYSETGGNLSITFDHVCSALRFWVKKANNISGHTLRVSSIKLKNVVKQANYFYSRGWDLTDNLAEYTLFSGSEQVLESTDYIPMDGGEPSYLFMIPQTLTAWNPTGDLSNTYLELTCSIDGGASQTAYIPFAATLEKGKRYDVKINIGKNSLYSGPNTKIITE